MMSVTVQHEENRTLLTVQGVLDALTANDLRPVLDKLIDEKRTPIVVNLAELRLIDSSGVGALVSLLKRVRAQGGKVSIEGLKDQPLAIFRLLRLDRVFSP